MSPVDLGAAKEYADACGRDGEPSTARLILALAGELGPARAFAEHVRSWLALDPNATVAEVVEPYDRRVAELRKPAS